MLTGGIDEGPNLEALWLFATADEPILGYGSPFWTKPGLSYARAILDIMERWTNERNDDSACIIGTRLAACFWIHTKAVEIELKAVFWRREGKESCSRTRSGSVIGSWPTKYGYLKKKDRRSKKAKFYSFSSMTSKCPVCGSGACFGFGTNRAEQRLKRPYQLPRKVR